MKKGLILLILVLALPLVSAATLHGTIYDFELNQLEKVVLEINTKPAQKYLSTDGTYSLQVPIGNYKLTAKQVNSDLYTEENLTVAEEGDYSYDLFLIPDENSTSDILSDLDYTDNMDEDISALNNYSFWLTFSIVILILIAIISLFIIRKKKHEEISEDLTSKVLAAIKKEGRITQKELRKLFPYSEAKISLIITELEHKGKIEKIKRGRSNVIILK